jgi:hypothetical protein
MKKAMKKKIGNMKDVIRMENVNVIKEIEKYLEIHRENGRDIRLVGLLACHLISYTEIGEKGSVLSVLKVCNCLDNEIENYYIGTKMAELAFELYGTDVPVWLAKVIMDEKVEMIFALIEHDENMEKILQQSKREMEAA